MALPGGSQVDELEPPCLITSLLALACLSLSILTAIFPGEPRLASFIGAKDDGSGGDNWSCKMCANFDI